MNPNYHDPSELPVMMTIHELAAFLRVSKNTAYTLIGSGAIPSVKIGRQIRINRKDVENFVSHTSQV